MPTARYTSSVPADVLVSITRIDGELRSFRSADPDGIIIFYDWELPWGFTWVVRYKKDLDWTVHETIEIIDPDTTAADVTPPDYSSYDDTFAGLTEPT